MADEWYIEAVKFWGGVAGLGTAVFTLWDRAFRHRPVVEPDAVAEPDIVRAGLEEVGASTYLRITNPGDRAIVITRIACSKDERLGVWLYDSVYGIVAHHAGHQGLARVGGKATRSFSLHFNSELEKKTMDEKFNIRVYWRPINARFPRFPVYLQTSLSALLALSQDEWHLKNAESKNRR